MVIADPGMGGHFWTPISPVRGSIFHADSQTLSENINTAIDQAGNESFWNHELDGFEE
jgi:hypothetical protein